MATDTASAAPSLLPCPFCLRKDTVRVHPPTCDRSTPYNPADRAFPIVRCHGRGASMDGEDWDQSGRTAIEVWNRRAQPMPPAADQELVGYFHAEPFGWTDCVETDEGAIALCDRPAPPAVVEPLTSEQLQHLHHIDEFGLFCDFSEFEQIARAIEFAHGIGIKKGEGNGN